MWIIHPSTIWAKDEILAVGSATISEDVLLLTRFEEIGGIPTGGCTILHKT